MNYDTCEHEWIFCEVEITGGNVQYKNICKQCFKSEQPVKQSNLSKNQKMSAHKTTQVKIDAARHEKVIEWQTWYQEIYLKSSEWRRKRALILKRDKDMCQGCLRSPATTVHHLSYEHVSIENTDEFMFELISMCDECHARIHKKT